MSFHSVLSQYFLDPFGLLALLGLIPLIVFYLIRPEPEEQVMPSMAFFMQKKESGKIEKAIQKIQKNLLLLIHLLMIIGLAAAIAELYIEEDARPENAVVIVDRSASMSNDFEDARKFASSNLGEKNTLIVAGEDLKVPLEKASGSKTSNYIGSLKSRDVETDIAGALELASDYRGEVVVASDLDQTVSERSTEQLLQNLVADRNLKIYEPDRSNSWGIVDVKPGRQNSSVDVKNFLEDTKSIEVSVNGRTRELTVGGGEVRTLTFEPTNLNRIKLEQDSMKSDNQAFISVPPSKEFKVAFISDSGNPYFEKAVELISFTRIEVLRPPVDREIDADIYVVGRTDRMLETTARDIENRVENGASLVVFAQPGLADLGFTKLPLETGERKNTSVEFEQPRRINVGQTQVFEGEIEGKSMSNPEEALLMSSHGRGEIVLYNIRDEDFRFDFLYPVFWKQLFGQLLEKPSVEELNVATGDEINESWVETPSGERKTGSLTPRDAGFYNSSGGTYAANLASEEESLTEKVEFEGQTQTDSGSEKSLRRMLSILLVFLAVSELLYLRRMGDV